jgi:hypothetical protein
MFILESVMRAIKNLRLGALCLSFILTTGCTTMGKAFEDTFCQGFHFMGGGPDGIWESVTFPVCLLGLAAYVPVVMIQKASEESSKKESSQALSDRVKAGDLAESEECVLSACYAGYTFKDPNATRRQAAETVLKAYQDEPEPNLKTQVLLIFAHDYMDDALKDPESRRTHLEAIVRFGESKELWDAVNDPDFNISYDYWSEGRFEKSRGVYPGTIKKVQDKLHVAVIELLIMDQNSRVAGDPFQPFVCDLAPYQRAVDLAKVENLARNLYETSKPCNRAEGYWEESAIKQVKKRIGAGDLAAAERCLLDCANIKGINYRLGVSDWNAERLRRLAARSLIKAYESLPELDNHQQEMLEKARALNPEARD